MEYQKKEAAELEANAIAALDALGYSGYKILVFAHAGYNAPVVSQSFEGFEKFDGESYIPDGPPSPEQDIPPGMVPDGQNSSYFSKEKSVQNFQEDKSHKYRVNYFSLLIVFDSLESGKIARLMDILKDTVMDYKRGDNVVIESKEKK